MSRFRHPATVAIDDLLYLSVAISDEGASDALFALTPPPMVADTLRRFGIDGISVRHRTRDLTDTPAERLAPEVHLAHALAASATTAGQGHPIAQLDVAGPTPARPGPSSTCCTRCGARRGSRRGWRPGYAS